MFTGLDHLAIVVPDTEEALKTWRDRFGFPVLFSEVVNDGATRLTHLDLGNTQLQLVEPLKQDTPLAEWLQQHGAKAQRRGKRRAASRRAANGSHLSQKGARDYVVSQTQKPPGKGVSR